VEHFNRYISKSKYLEGLKCLKLLWYDFHNPKIIPHPGPMTRAVFEEGEKIGILAQSLFPDGIFLGSGYDFKKVSDKSIASLAQNKPLFEAGFLFRSTYAIADILAPACNGTWDIIEVKSSTDVKEEHIPDVAFQKYVYEGAGLKINKCFLMHIDNTYIKNGPIEPKKLFKAQDITEEVNEIIPEIEKEIDEMTLTIASDKEPVIEIGPFCNKPHDCPLKGFCWGSLPEDNVFILYRGGKFLYDLYKNGVTRISDIPLGMKLTDKQLIQIKTHKDNEEYIDKEALKDFLSQIEYPLYFLDFETMAPAIPAYDNSRPYEAIPFQYSLHIIKKEGAKPEHHGHIAKGNLDPRPEILKLLKEQLGTHGTIIAYNAVFEIRCLKKMAEVYATYKPFTDTIETRFVDLMTPFVKFMYYTPKQEGSYSMKTVLPALTGKSYEGLGIANGEVAQREYMRVTFDPLVTKEDKDKVLKDLEVYCGLDTQGMIDIFNVLKSKL
jgi:hypothetical protein